MKRLLLILLVCSVIGPAFPAAESSSSKPLEGSYPIILAHGILGVDSQDFAGLIHYWGGVDKYLRDQGVPVYAPSMNPISSSEERGFELKRKVRYWMAANDMSKVNIIGHSQGGLTARYMATNLGMKSKVATITSVNTPHKGTPFADIALDVIPNWIKPYAAPLINNLSERLYGDRNNRSHDILAMGNAFRQSYASVFNENTPNVRSIRYYSYGSHMKFADPVQHPIMFLVYPVTYLGGKHYGLSGKNDGIVPIESHRWGTYKGGPSTPWYSTGVDHIQATNWAYCGQAWYDVNGYYLSIAKNAKNNQ